MDWNSKVQIIVETKVEKTILELIIEDLNRKPLSSGYIPFYIYTVTSDGKLLIELNSSISTEYYGLRGCIIFNRILKKERSCKIDLPPHPMRRDLFICDQLRFETSRITQALPVIPRREVDMLEVDFFNDRIRDNCLSVVLSSEVEDGED